MRKVRPELGNLLPRDGPRRSIQIAPPLPAQAQLRDEVLGSVRASRTRRVCTNPTSRRSTILAIRDGMPRDEIQGLCFLLGLLLAFYFLTPFLELSLR